MSTSMLVLGVRIDEVNRSEAHQKVTDFLRSNVQHTIFTPNPEMLVDAQTDEYFKKVLNLSSLNICDGKGIELVTHGKLTRIPGVDFMLELCALAEKEGKNVYLLGSGDDVTVHEAKNALQNKFSSLQVVGSSPGLQLTMEQLNNGTMIKYESTKNDHVLDSIIEASPAILFVAFGHGKQEKWIYENLKHLPSVRIAMGVGGAFDILAGKVRRAPRLFRQFGLEWLWRLLIQPWRIGRIWKATVIFLVYSFKEIYGKRRRNS